MSKFSTKLFSFLLLTTLTLSTNSNALPFPRKRSSGREAQPLDLNKAARKQGAAYSGKYTQERCEYGSDTCVAPRMCREYPSFSDCHRGSTKCFCLMANIQRCNCSSHCMTGDRCYRNNNVTECLSCNRGVELASPTENLTPADEGHTCPRGNAPPVGVPSPSQPYTQGPGMSEEPNSDEGVQSPGVDVDTSAEPSPGGVKPSSSPEVQMSVEPSDDEETLTPTPGVKMTGEPSDGEETVSATPNVTLTAEPSTGPETLPPSPEAKMSNEPSSGAGMLTPSPDAAMSDEPLQGANGRGILTTAAIVVIVISLLLVIAVVIVLVYLFKRIYN